MTARVSEEARQTAGARLRAQMAEPLNRTSLGLVTSIVLTSGIGVAYWALAARIFPTRVVGQDTALVDAMMSISAVTQLNLANAFVRFLPAIGHGFGRRVVQGYTAAATAALLGSAAFVVIAPMASSRFDFLGSDATLAVAFVAATCAWTVFCLQDAVLTALGRTRWLSVENGLFSAVKLLLLPVCLLVAAGHGVFAAFVAPMFVAVPTVNWLIARRLLPSSRAKRLRAGGAARPLGGRPLTGFLLQDLFGSAAAQVATMSVPLLVIAVQGSAANAYFYMPFALVTTSDLLFGGVATALITEGARSPERISTMVRVAVRHLARFQVPATAVLVLGAPWILLPFGSGYAAHGAGVLRLLALASIARAVVYLFIACARLQGHGGRLLVAQMATAVVVVTGVLVGAKQGNLADIGLGWLLAWSAIALAVGPNVARFVRESSLDHESGGDDSA